MLPLIKREMFALVDVGIIDDGLKLAADTGGQRRCGGAVNQRIVIQTVLNQIGDGHDFELVFARELHEIRLARHGAVVFHDLADDAGGLEPGEASEVDRTLRLPGPN